MCIYKVYLLMNKAAEQMIPYKEMLRLTKHGLQEKKIPSEEFLRRKIMCPFGLQLLCAVLWYGIGT